MLKQFSFVNKDQPIDAVVLWVDGSDPEWKIEIKNIGVSTLI